MRILPEQPHEDNGAPTGEQLRDDALRRLAESSPAVLRKLQRAALEIALREGRVNADDVREHVKIPATVNPKLNGQTFRGLSRLRLLQKVGSGNSRRREAHARDLPSWTITDAVKAVRWLATNPELPEATD